jgi:hypothetical protein
MSLPRNGTYELFCHLGLIHCFDDPGFCIRDVAEIHEWIRQQPTDLWRGMDEPYAYTVYYLQPELYIWFKMRWI